MAIGNFVDFVGARFNASAIQSYLSNEGSAVEFVGSDDSTNGFTKLQYLIHMMRREEVVGYDVSSHKSIISLIATTVNPSTGKMALDDRTSYGLNILQVVSYIYRDNQDFNLASFDFIVGWNDYVKESLTARSAGYASALDMATKYNHNSTLADVDILLFTHKGDAHKESRGAPPVFIGLLSEGARGLLSDGIESKEYVTATGIMNRLLGVASGLSYDDMFGPNPLIQSDIRESSNYIYSIFKTESKTVTKVIFNEWVKPILDTLDASLEFSGDIVSVLNENTEPFNNFKNAATSLSTQAIQETVSLGRLAGYTPAFPFVALLDDEVEESDLKEMDELFSFVLPVLKNGNDEGYTPLSVLTERVSLSPGGAWSNDTIMGFIKSKILSFETQEKTAIRASWASIGGVNVSTNSNVNNAYGVVNNMFNKVYAARENEEILEGEVSSFPLAATLDAFAATEADYNLWVTAYK